LTSRIQVQKEEQRKSVQDLQDSSQKGDDELKKDLLLLASSLENKKVSGADLSNLLIELGHRLQKTKESK